MTRIGKTETRLVGFALWHLVGKAGNMDREDRVLAQAEDEIRDAIGELVRLRKIVRRFADDNPVNSSGGINFCRFCDCSWPDTGGHDPGCSWLAACDAVKLMPPENEPPPEPHVTVINLG